MIKMQEDNLELTGNFATIMAEFTGIIRGVDSFLTECIGKDMSEKLIVLAGKMAFNDKEKYNESLLQFIKDIV